MEKYKNPSPREKMPEPELSELKIESEIKKMNSQLSDGEFKINDSIILRLEKDESTKQEG